MLQRRTEDGYVFRVDLRLRPDGNASPIAISTKSAELYYESAGQNWERAALIKARACAGDIAAGEKFLKSLTPYIWRKNLDYRGHRGHSFDQAPNSCSQRHRRDRRRSAII